LGHLVNYADQYYDILSEVSVLTATDKDDFIDVYRQQNGQTRVRIMRDIKGDRKKHNCR